VSMSNYLFDRRTEEQKQADANAKRAYWGYHPRYEPVYPFSIKS